MRTATDFPQRNRVQPEIAVAFTISVKYISPGTMACKADNPGCRLWHV
jgi:hypothetical protein